MLPDLPTQNATARKQCAKCRTTRDTNWFAASHSLGAPDNLFPICNSCVDAIVREVNGNWGTVDKLCQCADIPFIPNEWQKIYQLNQAGAFCRYSQLFRGSQYESLGWSDYYNAFRELEENGLIEEELPLLSAVRERQLREKWGANYDLEALHYLEDLYNGLMATQNVNGSLQLDQAKKICKMSYEIDKRIEEGSDFDKLLGSYDKLVKAADFTPKNVKNPNDFDSVGELMFWLEKTGWENSYYDDVPRDIVDETIANIQAFNRRLYVNESGIGEEITQRLQALKQVEKIEQSDYYAAGLNEVDDLDKYDIETSNALFAIDEQEEFDPND